jgi:nicotinamide-nucleotide amidase
VRCEVVAIGTELLLGQIVDTNSSWIGEQLALAGIDSHFQVKVGDNFSRMEAAIRHALDRSDAVICCGGLGPTQDDITRDVLARIMGVALVRDEAVVEKIRHMFESRGRVMTDNNRRQADVPEGATLIPQMPGTAPGLICPVGDKVVYAVPGVPHEMREMMEGTILPDLRRRAGKAAAIRSRVLRTWGQSESGLAEILANRIEELDEIGNPTLAFLASGIEGIKVRITAKAEDTATAERILASEETLIRGLLGDIVFGIDEQSMETVVIDALRTRGMTLAVAETVTGGVMAARLTDADRDYEVFRGGAILPGQHAAEVPHEGAAERAAAVASQVRETFGADVGIAAVRPFREEGHTAGTVFLSLAIGDERHAATVDLFGDRTRMRNYTVIGLLNFLRKTLAEG